LAGQKTFGYTVYFNGELILTFQMFSNSSGGGLVPPLPWEIEEDAVQPFKDEVRLIEVPHTESTKTCHRCRGTGDND
jgi:hypothetical protein